MKQTVFHNANYTRNRNTTPDITTLQTAKNNLKVIHTAIVQSHLQTRTNNAVLNDTPPKINAQEQTLPCYTRRILAQLRANKCSRLMEYFHKISPDTHPTPMYPLCNAHTHNTNHRFTYQHIHTTLTPITLWEDPVGAADILSRLSAVLGWWLDQPWEGPLDQGGLAEKSTIPLSVLKHLPIVSTVKTCREFVSMKFATSFLTSVARETLRPALTLFLPGCLSLQYAKLCIFLHAWGVLPWTTRSSNARRASATQWLPPWELSEALLKLTRPWVIYSARLTCGRASPAIGLRARIRQPWQHQLGISSAWFLVKPTQEKWKWYLHNRHAMVFFLLLISKHVWQRGALRLSRERRGPDSPSVQFTFIISGCHRDRRGQQEVASNDSFAH